MDLSTYNVNSNESAAIVFNYFLSYMCLLFDCCRYIAPSTKRSINDNDTNSPLKSCNLSDCFIRLERISTGQSRRIDKYFNCTTCAKLFRRSCDLLRHKRIHSRKKPNVFRKNIFMKAIIVVIIY